MESYQIVGYFPEPEGWYNLVAITAEGVVCWEPMDSRIGIPAQLIPAHTALLDTDCLLYHVLYHTSEGVH